MGATLLAALVAGAVVGLVVDLALPGRSGLTARATALLGALGATVATWIYMAASGSHAAGVHWTSLTIGAVAAGVLVGGHRYVPDAGGSDWANPPGNRHSRQRPSGYEG